MIKLRRPDEFDRMAERLIDRWDCASVWDRTRAIADALRRVDRAAEKRGYQLGYDKCANEQAELDAGEDI